MTAALQIRTCVWWITLRERGRAMKPSARNSARMGSVSNLEIFGVRGLATPNDFLLEILSDHHFIASKTRSKVRVFSRITLHPFLADFLSAEDQRV